jgi:hypothetical protein
MHEDLIPTCRPPREHQAGTRGWQDGHVPVCGDVPAQDDPRLPIFTQIGSQESFDDYSTPRKLAFILNVMINGWRVVVFPLLAYLATRYVLESSANQKLLLANGAAVGITSTSQTSQPGSVRDSPVADTGTPHNLISLALTIIT